MITDPYKVLGISPSATDDEVKKAYRDLSKKYHPDTNANNPLADLAEERFKEVQDAYQTILDQREKGGKYTYSQGSSSQYSSSYASQDDPKTMSAVNLINAGQYREALNVLSGISNHTGRWNYLNAVAHAGLRNNMEALNFARQAVSMEPNNPEYKDLLNRLQWGGQRYNNNSAGYGYGNSSCGTGNLCCDLWCADSLCECMGGDICSCL